MERSSQAPGARPGRRVAILGAGAGGLCMGIGLRGRATTPSRSSRSRTTSAAPGTTTATPARPATCRRTSTRSRSSEPRVEPRVLARSRRSRATCATAPRSTACCRRSASAPRSQAASFDESAGLWRIRTCGGRGDRGRRSRQRARSAEPSAVSRSAGSRVLRGDDLPLGALGPRARSPRRARRGGRQRRERDPVHPGDRDEVAQLDVFQRARTG